MVLIAKKSVLHYLFIRNFPGKLYRILVALSIYCFEEIFISRFEVLSFKGKLSRKVCCCQYHLGTSAIQRAWWLDFSWLCSLSWSNPSPIKFGALHMLQHSYRSFKYSTRYRTGFITGFCENFRLKNRVRITMVQRPKLYPIRRQYDTVFKTMIRIV